MLDEPLYVNFRFAVSFLSWGGQSGVVDTRFQRVSGLSATVTSDSVSSGGQNTYSQSLPTKVGYGALSLVRGHVVKSPLNSRFEDALYRFDFKTSDVLVMLLSEIRTPIAAWKFHRAYPTGLTIGTDGALDAATPGILINTMTLAYTTMKPVPI